MVQPLEDLVDDDNVLDRIRNIMGGEDIPELGPYIDDRFAASDAAYKAQRRIVGGLEAGGIRENDWFSGNVGLTGEGRLVAHDPGVFQNHPDVPTSSVFRTGEDVPFRNEVRRRSASVGAPDYIRDVLERDAAIGAGGQGVPVPEIDAVRPAMDRLASLVRMLPPEGSRDRAAMEAILRRIRGG
jgi:hypothetical protein